MATPQLDVMAGLQNSPRGPHPEAFVEALEPLQRGSIRFLVAQCDARKLSLTVDCVRYVIGKRKSARLASTFLRERITPGDR